MSGIYEITEESMIAAHKAGASYWQRNKPIHATRESLSSLARSCHWHDAANESWLAGFYGAKRRDVKSSMFIFYFAEYGYDENAGPFSIFSSDSYWNHHSLYRCNESVWLVPGTEA